MRLTVFTVLLLLTGLLPAQNDTILGDLTGDGIAEMAVLYDLKVEMTELGYDQDTLAELIIYRRDGNFWEVWPEATGPMMYAYSEHGFTRFGASIERRTLVLEHYSGGYTSVGFTHRFRWQNDRFELIGSTSTVFERCTGGKWLDYNLSTGNYEYREYTTDCNSELDDPSTTTFSRKGRLRKRKPLLLAEFTGWEHQLVVPGRGAVGF